MKPDAQSWALVSLAAYASPVTIATQLKAVEEPFWRAYFLADCGAAGGRADAGGLSDGSQRAGEGRGRAGVKARSQHFN